MKQIKLRLLSLLLLAAMILLCSCSAAEPMGSYKDGGVSAPGEHYAASLDAEDGVEGDGKNSEDNSPNAGVLTAGEWNDNENWSEWLRRLNANEWYSIGEKWDMLASKRIKVNVRTESDAPVKNASVTLYGEGDKVLFKAVSDYAGVAYLFYNVRKSESPAVPVKIAVSADGKTVDTAYSAENDTTGEVNVTIEAAQPPKKLELMFMVDTTGSMGDELDFLKTELIDVAKAVKTELQISVSISVNFYRDTEDEYVIRDFPFTTDFEAVQANLSAQRPDGGGDYPEAVHTALDNAVNRHQWSSDTVKLMFFVLDAPPHDETAVVKTLYPSIEAAAEKGIRIIPVASSGVDLSTEVFLRTAANLTGGTYVFITDDSGVGGSHLEASVGDYEVEKLNELMKRLIKEYCS